jgi:L-seryl-tRNA(Ser) seleniumtransferase
VRDPDGLAARLRAGEPAVVGRVSKGAWIVDARTVRDDEVAPLLAALAAARVTG